MSYTDKPCACQHGLWHPTCPKHGLSENDTRVGYLMREYQIRIDNLREHLRK